MRFAQRATDEGDTFVDQVAVPTRAVLVGYRDDRVIGEIGPREVRSGRRGVTLVEDDLDDMEYRAQS